MASEGAADRLKDHHGTKNNVGPSLGFGGGMNMHLPNDRQTCRTIDWVLSFITI